MSAADPLLTPEHLDRGVVAMSGGVDSSVTAALLKAQGHELVAISMRLYEAPPRSDRSCCSPDDLFDARSVATRLDIPFYVANYVDAFRERVIDYFLDEYRRGRTPNPCVACNNHLKFEVLLARTRALGGRWLATGHYARVEEGPEGWRLLRGADTRKDQSYFLFGIPRDALPAIRFPLGHLTKPEVRDLAEQHGLPTAAKAESQEICFVSGEDYSAFVKRKLADEAPRPGTIELEDGTVVGHHDGVHAFTVGQRRGLGVAWHEPLFVLGVDPRAARVIVGPLQHLDIRALRAERCNWLSFERPPGPLEVEVQLRYRSRPVPALITPLEDGQSVEVEFKEPQRAVAPGQAAVFYRGDEVLGGGTIEITRR